MTGRLQPSLQRKDYKMFKDPCLDIPYCPRARDLLGGIGVYDLEETLGEELWKLNPNDTEDRTHIIKNIF